MDQDAQASPFLILDILDSVLIPGLSIVLSQDCTKVVLSGYF